MLNLEQISGGNSYPVMLKENMLELVNGGSDSGYHRLGEFIGYLESGDYEAAVRLYKDFEYVFDDNDKYSYRMLYESFTGEPMP